MKMSVSQSVLSVSLITSVVMQASCNSYHNYTNEQSASTQNTNSRVVVPINDQYGDLLPEGALERMGKASPYYDDSITDLCFFPDGKKLLSCETSNKQQMIRLWEISTGILNREFEGLNMSIALSLDGKKLALSRGNVIYIWDTTTWTELYRLQSNNVISALIYAPNGKTLVSCSWTEPKSICIWNTSTRNVTLKIEKADWPVAFSPDGVTIAAVTANNNIHIWEVSTGMERLCIESQKASICSMRFSPDGRTLASGGLDKTICLWETDSGKNRLALIGHKGAVSSVDFSPDGKILASGSWDKTIRLWETSTGKNRLCIPAGSVDTMSDGHGGEVVSIAFSPDGTRLASGMSRKTIIIWDVATMLKDRK